MKIDYLKLAIVDIKSALETIKLIHSETFEESRKEGIRIAISMINEGIDQLEYGLR